MSVPSADTSSATAVEADQAHQSGILGVSVEPLEMSQGTSPEDITFPTGTKLGVILLALGLSLILTGLDGSILATAIPTITTEFKTTADTGWYVAGFRLTSISFQFIFGKMYQMYSIKTIFMITCAIFELGSLLCATAPTSHAFILGRAVCGLGTCGIIQGVFTIAGQSVPVRQRALYGGMGSGVEAIASVSAPLLGGIITESIGWRWCFYINLPLGAISIGIIALYFKDPQINPSLSLPFKEKLARLDLFGTMIFIPSITTCLLALQYGGSKYEWNDPRMIILFVAFSVGLGIFIWMQYRQQDRGTIPPRIILQRSVISGFIFSCSNNAALNIVEYYMPMYFQVAKQTSVARSGVMVLPCICGLLISVVLGGALTTALGYFTPFMVLTSVLTPIAAGLLTTLELDAKLASLIGYQFLLGFGAGIGFQAPQVAVQTILSHADAHIGIAIIQFAQGFGPAIFVPIAQTIFQNRLTINLKQYAPTLNTTFLEDTGLLHLNQSIGALELDGVLHSYDKAVTQTFYLAVALSLLTLIGSLGMEYRSVKEKRN